MYGSVVLSASSEEVSSQLHIVDDNVTNTSAALEELSANAIIFFDEAKRQDVLSTLASFDIKDTEVAVPEHTGRKLRIEYEDKMFFHIAQKLLRQLIVPTPIRYTIVALGIRSMTDLLDK